jgi:sorting nexin-8
VKKIETAKSAQKPGWEVEVDKLVAGECRAGNCAFQTRAMPTESSPLPLLGQIFTAQRPQCKTEFELTPANEQDNSAITSLLSRRVFIRACMWHELAIVFHSRQAAQATLGWRDFAREEAESSAGITKVWEELGERLGAMPVE